MKRKPGSINYFLNTEMQILPANVMNTNGQLKELSLHLIKWLLYSV